MARFLWQQFRLQPRDMWSPESLRLAPERPAYRVSESTEQSQSTCTLLTSSNVRPKMTDSAVAAALRAVSSEKLRAFVDMLAFPRHYVAERDGKCSRFPRPLAQFRSRALGTHLSSRRCTDDNIVVTSGAADKEAFSAAWQRITTRCRAGSADEPGSAVAVLSGMYCPAIQGGITSARR